jgi:hypothetical protein
MNLKQLKTYYNTKPVTYVIKENYKLKEDNIYVPRFNIKNAREIEDVPINKPMKPDMDLIIKAIKYGMIFLMNYKGAEDNHFAGSERTFYPLVIGKSSEGKLLIRGYHLTGWSVSSNRQVKKTWRMFRLDRVLSMTFTGSFFRLPPAGYNMNDKGMRGGIIARADFTQIRKNQQTLVKANQIQDKDEISLSDSERKFITIRINDTETEVDLKTPLENQYISNSVDVKDLRVSFLKSIYGNKYIAVMGTYGQAGNTVKVLDDKGYNLGVYKVMDSIDGDKVKRIKNIKGNSVYKLYLFDKKI